MCASEREKGVDLLREWMKSRGSSVKGVREDTAESSKSEEGPKLQEDKGRKKGEL